MKLTKQQRETRQVEIVETYNLMLSVKRMQAAPWPTNWRRALYHALGMAQLDNTELERIRIALQLP